MMVEHHGDTQKIKIDGNIMLFMSNFSNMNRKITIQEALRSAATNGHVEVVRLLLEAGADIHAENDWALQEAC
jgi:ankyrin repeat protein